MIKSAVKKSKKNSLMLDYVLGMTRGSTEAVGPKVCYRSSLDLFIFIFILKKKNNLLSPLE